MANGLTPVAQLQLETNMNAKFILTMLWICVINHVTFADEFLDQCSSSQGTSFNDIRKKITLAIKTLRSDCIGAILSNENIDSRFYAVQALDTFSVSEQIQLLEIGLNSSGAWIVPQRHGEDIVGFRRISEYYIKILRNCGVNATLNQLLTDSGRAEIIQNLDLVRSGKAIEDPEKGLSKDNVKTTQINNQPTSVPSIPPTPVPPKSVVSKLPTTPAGNSWLPWGGLAALVTLVLVFLAARRKRS